MKPNAEQATDPTDATSDRNQRMGKFEPYRLSGLWHVHTDVTDGKHDPDALFTFATENRFPLIGFVEHVRRSPTYDFHAFYDRIHERAGDYDIACAVGCEAKVLDESGTLDVSSDVATRADVVYVAYHGTQFDRDGYLESVRGMLSNPIVDVWAHPFAYPARKALSLTADDRRSILEYAGDNEVALEYTLHQKYASSRQFAPELSTYWDVIGYDLHDLSNW